MRYLLDTSVFLWSRSAESKLNVTAKTILTSPSAELYLSAASSWEISIKYALGSLRLPTPPSEFMPEALRTWALRSLDITHTYALHAGQLPQHHRDPFDRMLVAQAQLEQMAILTVDRVFWKYDVEAVDCRA